MSDPKLVAAAGIMGQALGGISAYGGEDYGADFTVESDRVWTRITLESGDVYEISTRWVSEDSP